MEIQFEQNRDFNQSHREENNEEVKKGQPQGEEGNPNQRIVSRDDINNEEKQLDRRPADLENGQGDSLGNETSSAIAGVQSDQQNSTRNTSNPSGEDPNNNTDTERQKEETDDNE